MNIAIVTNLNGIGLERDFLLLQEFITSLGHTVRGFQYDQNPEAEEKFDLAIFLEVAPRNLLGLSDRRWIFVNPEWCLPEKLQTIDRSFEKIFAKTKEGARILNQCFIGRVHYVGFLARDQYDPAVKRRNWFLHIGGNSQLRGTQAVLDAWKWKRNGKYIEAHLCIVSSALKDRPVMKNVDIWEKLSEADLKTLQNQCRFHIYPSETEGYGHVIHEALGVGATVLLTDAPPLDRIGECFPMPATKEGNFGLADLYKVDAITIYQSVGCILSGEFNFHAREQFMKDNQAFKEAFALHLEEFSPKPVPITRSPRTGKSMAFIGNFEASESTENMVKWALENRLDWNVETLQENRVNLAAIQDAMKFNDALLWIRTPGWLNITGTNMIEFLSELRLRKIPTISAHLDKFWDIPAREARIGLDAFWFTQFVWTADGSRQDDFKNRGVNHFWMRPAVSEVYCHPGTPRDEYRCDVGFVGAKDYHSEYLFRKQLVEFLENEYGNRFKHITGLRGHGLNDFYASCKVVVGDCIFAGTPNYWSDRVPETCGRYGLLIHPAVEGLHTPMWFYEPQNLVSLKTTIEGMLSHSKEKRMSYIVGGAEYTRTHDTWTIRMAEILKEAGL